MAPDVDFVRIASACCRAFIMSCGLTIPVCWLARMLSIHDPSIFPGTGSPGWPANDSTGENSSERPRKAVSRLRGKNLFFISILLIELYVF